MFFSSVFSVDPLFSFIGSDQLPTGSFLSYFVVYVFVLFFYVNRQIIERELIVNCIVFAGFIMSLYGIVQHFGIDPYDWFNYKEFHLRVFTTIGNPIQYGMYVGAISFLLFNKFLTAKVPRLQILFSLMWVISVLATLYSGSRAPVLLQAALFVVSISYFFIYLKSEKSIKIKCTIAILLFLSAHYIYFIENRNNAVAERLAPKAFSTGLKVRTTVWQTGFKSGLDHPVLGIGPELFFVSYYKHKPAFHNMYQTWNETMNKAHNEFVQIWVTQGILGIFALAFILLLYLKQSLKKIIPRNYTDHQFSEFFIFIAVIFLILNNLLAFNLFPTLVLIILLMTLAFWTEESISVGVKKTSLSKSARTMVMIFWVGLIVNIIPFWKGNDLYCRAFNLKKTPKLYDALSSIQQAIEINPTRTYYNCNYVELLIQSYLLQKETSKVNYPAFIDELKSIAQLCVSSQPYNFFTWHQVGYNFLKLAQQDKNLIDYSILNLEKAIALHPNTPLLFVELAFAYELKGDFKTAFKFYNEAIIQKGDFLEAYFRKLLPLYRMKNFDEINTTVDHILNADWANSTYKSIKFFLDGTIDLAAENQDRPTEMKLRLLKLKLMQSGTIN